MDKIKTVKIKNEDGSISEESYTISADARNVDMDNGKDLQDTIGNIDIDSDGNIAEQLKDLNNNINDLNTNIKKKAYFFNTVEEMKAANLHSNDFVITLGYYTANDGGGASYIIRAKKTNDIEDNGSIHFLNNNWVAELIIENNKVNVKQFGAKGDGIVDDSDAIRNAVNSYTNIEGVLGEQYYITKAININNKNLFNLNIKAEPFRVSIGNTYLNAFNLTGNNNLRNIRVESEFKYIPSIEIHADPSSQNGLASNVHAFNVTSGITNFYDCKANFCWAFNIISQGKVNIYNFIGTNLEMSFFVSSQQDVKVYNSKFNINKTVDSIYYHHIYATQRTNTEFNNCEFTETGEGTIGNHYHGYSASINEGYDLSGKMVINNCNLITTAWMGQINCVDLYVNGGSVEAALLLSGGSYINKPTAYFKNVDIKVNASGSNSDYALSYPKVNIENCHIYSEGLGTKHISNLPYKIYNSTIDTPNGTFHNAITADAENIVTDEIVMNNCIINSKSYTWCYPYYCTNVKISNCSFNLSTLKQTSNPVDRGTIGFVYNCIFNNWTLPLNALSDNTLKIDYIYDGIKKSNIQ